MKSLISRLISQAFITHIDIDHGAATLLDYSCSQEVNISPSISTCSIQDETVIFKIALSSPYLLDIVFLMSALSNNHRILVCATSLSTSDIRFFKKMGVKDFCDFTDYKVYRANFQIVTTGQAVFSNFPEIYSLTKTEIEILYLLSLGLTIPSISDSINRSYHTIKNHKINIARKIGLDHCYQIVSFVQAVKNNTPKLIA